jgi:hypothetical protein
MTRAHRPRTAGLASLLAAAAALAMAAGLENVPADSRLYSDFDLLKTSELIHSMPSTSRPWTRGECVRLLLEARSADPSSLGPAQRAALRRLEFEFGAELPALPARQPLVRIPVPDLGKDEARCDFFSYADAALDTQQLSLGAVINNRPDDSFVFYERFDMAVHHPKIIEVDIRPDSSGAHIPGTRVMPFHDLVTLETELAYLAFRIPWLRLELGRDEFVWGPGYTGSVILDDAAPALDHVQLCASYRNFKFLTFTSLLSRWGTKPRWLAAQRIELSLRNRLTLGSAILVVTSWDELRPAQLGGLVNPLIPVVLSEENSASEGNSFVGCDAVYYLSHAKVYGQLSIDDYNFDQWGPNAVGIQSGAHWTPNLPVDVRIEYTRITAFTYYHRVSSIMFENYLSTMGHPLGPDADVLLAAVGFTPNDWFRADVEFDYTRRGYHNRGDCLRKGYKNPEDTFYLRHHDEFPTRGWDTLSGALTEEVDRTSRIEPQVEIRTLRYLFVSLSVGLWRSQNYLGAIGLNKDGVDLALKVEYRY